MPESEPDARSLLAAARAWRELDPDPATRAELDGLIATRDLDELAARFGSRLEFGTAGIRGTQGAGPNRMNRVTVRRMAAGVAAHLGAGTHVVLGYDARHNSDVFAADAAQVLAAAGVRASIIDGYVPTPVLSYAVPALGADLGLMVTASHNPPADNGCKVFLASGAQLRAPLDAAIEAAIDAAAIPPRALPAPAGDGAIERAERTIVADYVDHIVAEAPLAPGNAVRIAYTPLHGVGRDVLLQALRAAGALAPEIVASQAEPDPDFPTVSFPNPEEPGAMDAVVALAAGVGADLAVANDPDADRFAVAVPTATGGWRALTGDEVGALLCDHLVASASGTAYKVVSTVVCSSLVGKLTEAAGLTHRVTLTGFKWIMAEAYADEALPPLLAYEESLGYASTRAVRDKDGISATLRFLDLTHDLAQRGSTPARRLDEIAVDHGLHATRQFSVRFSGADAVAMAGAAVDALRSAPPAEMAGRRVAAVTDYAGGGDLPPTNLLRFDLEGGLRVLVRPSGTEPKTKLYLEQVVPVSSVDEVPTVRAETLASLDAIGPALETLLTHAAS